MIPKGWAVMLLLVIPIALTINVFFLEPNLYVHPLPPHVHDRMIGEREIVLFLDMFSILMAMFVGLWKNNEDSKA